MLTLAQVLAVSGQDPRSVMSVRELPVKFPTAPLSIAKVSEAFEAQRRIAFIGLASARLFLSGDVNTFADFSRLVFDLPGQMSQSNVLALSNALEPHGVLLRLVDKFFRTAAVIGTTESLVNVPATVIDERSFLAIRDLVRAGAVSGSAISTDDFSSGITVQDLTPGDTNLLNGIVIIGTVFLAIGLAPTAIGISAAAGPWVAGTGAAIMLLGAGIYLLNSGDKKPPETTSPAHSENDVSPDGDGAGEGNENTIDLPNAVALGDPPSGLNTDGLVTDVGNPALDLILAGIPIGWDPDTGSGLPGLGSSDPGGEADGATSGFSI